MIRAIVTDIEGTTSSLAFVKDVLFPYADQHMAAFVQQHQQEPAVAEQLEALRVELEQPDLPIDAAVAKLRAWMAADKKATPLKALQGLLWEAGYRQGDYTGHVYADAADYLQRWHERGIKLYVYSSGSVYAQKLLFGHSDYGDLTPLFSGYFDTNIGHKREAAAYAHIVQELDLPAEQILFLSDIPAELDAAKQAGMQTYCLVREQQATEGLQHPWGRDFAAVDGVMFVNPEQ